MKLEDLLEKINLHNVPERWYSINDGIKPMAYVVFENYGLWECFCMDERGERNELTFFRTPEEAYDWLWKSLSVQLAALTRK